MSNEFLVTSSIVEQSLVHANERIKFEYDRFGLQNQKRLQMIQMGTIGQLIFQKYLNDHEVKFEFEFQAGKYDTYDFKANDRIIEVKTSGFDKPDEWRMLNAIYNTDQMSVASQKNIECVVQIFLNGYSKADRSFTASRCSRAVIAGWAPLASLKRSQIRSLPYGPAHLLPIQKLRPIDHLIASL